MSVNVDEIFEMAKNEPLRERVAQLVEAGNVDFNKVFSKAKHLTLTDAATRPPKYKQRNYMAEMMYCNVVGLLHDNHPDQMRKDKHGRPYFVLAPDIRIYPKKLSEAYLPMNIRTEHVSELNSQELFEDDQKIHVVYAGYVVSENDWTQDFKEVCLAYVNNVYTDKPAWLIDLREDRFQKSAAIVTSLQPAIHQTQDLVTVRKSAEGNSAAGQ